MNGRRFQDDRCEHACRPPYYNSIRGGPCPACAARHNLWMDEATEEHFLQQEHKVILRILPATDQEWFAYLDQVAPVVTEQIRINDQLVWVEPINFDPQIPSTTQGQQTWE